MQSAVDDMQMHMYLTEDKAKCGKLCTAEFLLNIFLY